MPLDSGALKKFTISETQKMVTEIFVDTISTFKPLTLYVRRVFCLYTGAEHISSIILELILEKCLSEMENIG
jgi:hypothetical protein